MIIRLNILSQLTREDRLSLPWMWIEREIRLLSVEIWKSCNDFMLFLIEETDKNFIRKPRIGHCRDFCAKILHSLPRFQDRVLIYSSELNHVSCVFLIISYKEYLAEVFCIRDLCKLLNSIHGLLILNALVMVFIICQHILWCAGVRELKRLQDCRICSEHPLIFPCLIPNINDVDLTMLRFINQDIRLI